MGWLPPPMTRPVKIPSARAKRADIACGCWSSSTDSRRSSNTLARKIPRPAPANWKKRVLPVSWVDKAAIGTTGIRGGGYFSLASESAAVRFTAGPCCGCPPRLPGCARPATPGARTVLSGCARACSALSTSSAARWIPSLGFRLPLPRSMKCFKSSRPRSIPNERPAATVNAVSTVCAVCMETLPLPVRMTFQVARRLSMCASGKVPGFRRLLCRPDAGVMLMPHGVSGTVRPEMCGHDFFASPGIEGNVHPGSFLNALVIDDCGIGNRARDAQGLAEFGADEVCGESPEVSGVLRALDRGVQGHAAVARVDMHRLAQQCAHLLQTSGQHVQIRDDVLGRSIVDTEALSGRGKAQLFQCEVFGQVHRSAPPRIGSCPR